MKISISFVYAYFLVYCMEVARCWMPNPEIRRLQIRTTQLLAKKQSKSATLSTVQEEETVVDVVGAEFFGGNKQKEEFYDPIAEAEAGLDLNTDVSYKRFEDRDAFADSDIAAIANSLQIQINNMLYENEKLESNDYCYAKNIIWSTPFQVKSRNPLTELGSALGFYRRLDLAITSGKRLDDNLIELRWELSVAWPTFWEPRVVITGSSKLSLNDKEIEQQADELDTDLSSCVTNQLIPRFWDAYHIGMTPSAEMGPRFPLSRKSPFSSYNLYELPPRLFLEPTLLDSGSREDANANIIPNHAFSCIIKTMGPEKQRYVPTSPVEIHIVPQAMGPLKLLWRIPISVECLTSPALPLPEADPEADPSCEPDCRYVWLGKRKVATLKYGGEPQDMEIAELRKTLYEMVTRDGLKPKLDSTGRPIFFFWKNAAKACFTEEGLGMAVYDWRPKLAQSNEVGLELQL